MKRTTIPASFSVVIAMEESKDRGYIMDSRELEKRGHNLTLKEKNLYEVLCKEELGLGFD